MTYLTSRPSRKVNGFLYFTLHAPKYFSPVGNDVYIRRYQCLPNGGYVFRNHYAVAGDVYIYIYVAVAKTNEEV